MTGSSGRYRFLFLHLSLGTKLSRVDVSPLCMYHLPKMFFAKVSGLTRHRGAFSLWPWKKAGLYNREGFILGLEGSVLAWLYLGEKLLSIFRNTGSINGFYLEIYLVHTLRGASNRSFSSSDRRSPPSPRHLHAVIHL